MSRVFIAALMLGGLTIAAPSGALAFDYEEPVLPNEFLMAPASTVQAPSESSLALLRLQEDGAPRTVTTLASAPQPPARPAYGSSGCADGSGRALWTYNAC
ncbi:MAG TPA: hypothetical protein VFE37_11900 [Chloroflexota bacterium]|nr:hypothetical protein [Chloroflexota bacterium]